MRIRAKYISIGLTALTTILSLAAGGARLQAEEPLRWKFDVGEKLDYTMVQDMKMSTGGDESADGNQNGVKMHQEIDMIWDVQGVDAKTGEAVIKQKFDRLKTKLTSPQGEFEYDSKSEAAPSALAAMLAPLYKAMTQNDFEITMTSRGEIKDVKIPEEVLAALKSSPGAAAMGDIATAEGFKKMISKGALVLPENPPKQGESWETKVEMNNPIGGKQIVQTSYRYDGKKDVDGTTYAVFKPQLKMDFGDWKEILSVKGSGTKKSAAFELNGSEIRLRYKYNSAAGQGTGSFAVFVIPEGKDVDKVGGTPEVTTQAPKVESESALHKDAGKYYLNVIAAGDWDVVVEEKSKSSPQLPMKVAAQSSDGEVLFNVEKGRLYSMTLQQKVTIEATAQGQTAHKTIDQKIDVKVTPFREKKTEETKKPEASEEKAKK